MYERKFLKEEGDSLGSIGVLVDFILSSVCYGILYNKQKQKQFIGVACLVMVWKQLSLVIHLYIFMRTRWRPKKLSIDAVRNDIGPIMLLKYGLDKSGSK